MLRCRQCGHPLKISPMFIGRPKRYCSERCRKAAQRAKAREAAEAVASEPEPEPPPPKPPKAPRRSNPLSPQGDGGVTGDGNQEKKAIVLEMLGRGYSLA